MSSSPISRARSALVVLLFVAASGSLARAESPNTDQLLREIDDLKRQNSEFQRQSKENQQKIERLGETVRDLQTKQAEAPPAVETVAKDDQEISDSAMVRAMDRYLGPNRFLLTGWGAARYNWNDAENSNTFLATFAPIFLYRLNDSLMFEGELELELEDDGSTEVELEYAQIDWVLNDYSTLVAGKYLLPFGEFIERLHPAWINKLATSPLIYREGGGILPFTALGAQVRGGFDLGYGLGAHAGYTVYVANGPRYESDEGGAPFVANNVDINRNKAFGARLEMFPLPLDWDAGWLRFGGSTYNGKWDEAGEQWFTSWGLDGLYWYDDFELRGEFISTRRALDGPQNDLRDGWYLQASYQLASLLPSPLDRLELVARYAAMSNRFPQHEEEEEEEEDEDDDGHAEFGRVFSPGDESGELLNRPREISIGLDYWITPSFVAKVEYDRSIPQGEPANNQIWVELALGF